MLTRGMSEESFQERIEALKERRLGSDEEERDDVGLWQGALQEAGRIEWPTLPNALGNTALVVTIVIASSALLTAVNAVFSRASQALF